MIRDNRHFGHEFDQFDLGKPSEPSSFLKLRSRVFDMNPPSVQIWGCSNYPLSSLESLERPGAQG
jgi:hypothetical protein